MASAQRASYACIVNLVTANYFGGALAPVVATNGGKRMGADLVDKIQAIINKSVTGNSGMVAAVVSETFTAPMFFWPTTNPVWTANHTEVTGSDICNLSFSIGSITKVFTSRLFQGCYGKTIGGCMPSIDLPDLASGLDIASIGSYVSGYPQDNGLPPDPRGAFCPNSAYANLDTLVGWFNSGCSNHASWICPQQKCYTYSNLAWSLFAIAALNPANTDADVYGAYDTQLQGLCQALGITNTALYAPTQVGDGMACGYTSGGQPFEVGQNYQPCPTMTFGAGAIVSKIQDMLQWLQYNMGQLAVSRTDKAILTAEQMSTSPVNKCGTSGSCGSSEEIGPTTGQGWFFPTIRGGKPGQVLSKDGGVSGFSSWMGFESWIDGDSPSQNGVAVLGAGKTAPAAGVAIMSALLNTDIEAPMLGAIGPD